MKNRLSSKRYLKLNKKIENLKLLVYELNNLLIYSDMSFTSSLYLNIKQYSSYYEDFKYFLTHNNKLKIAYEFNDKLFVKYLKKFKILNLNNKTLEKDLISAKDKHTIYVVLNPTKELIETIHTITYFKQLYKSTYFIYVGNEKTFIDIRKFTDIKRI